MLPRAIWKRYGFGRLWDKNDFQNSFIFYNRKNLIKKAHYKFNKN